MADVKFIHSSAGYVELMKSGEMRETLGGYAQGIYDAATGALSPDKGTPLDNEPYAMRSFETAERAGVRVQTNNVHARYAEAKNGILQNAAGV